MILAWESKDARAKAEKIHGFKMKPYESRPIKKSHWEKKRDHPIHGLGQYEVQENNEG